MPTILGTPHSEKHRKNLKGMGVGYEISCIWAPKGKNWGPQLAPCGGPKVLGGSGLFFVLSG